MKNVRLISKPVLSLLLSVVAAGSMTYYVTEIWSAGQAANFSDLYAPWWAAHELLLHGRNPYSPGVAHEIQTVIYGAPVTPSADDPSGLAGGYAYPPYAVFLLWPAIYLPFPAAQKVFLFVAVLALLLSLTLWLRALRLHLTALHGVMLALFVLGSFPALQALALQNLSLVAAALLAITLFFLSRGHLILAGIFLAVSTFKPQFTVVLIPWLLIWIVADWRARRPLALSFLGTTGLLGIISEWLAPGWIPSFLHVVGAYRRYTYGHSLLDVWFAPAFGPVVSVILLLVALAVSWLHRAEPAGSPRFLLVTSMVLAANVVVIPTLAPHAQLLLIPGFLCLLPQFRSHWISSSFARTLQAAAWMLLAWPWAAAFGLLMAAFWVRGGKLNRFWEVPLYTSPLLPLAVLLALVFLVRARPEPSQHDSAVSPGSPP